MAKKRSTETEDQARQRILAEVLADPAYTGASESDPDVTAAVEARLGAWRNARVPEESKGAYEWLNQLPPDYRPPLRGSIEAPRGLYGGMGLIDGNGRFVRDANGRVKEMYEASDVQSIWRGIAYPDRKKIAEYMQAFGIYGGAKPSLNLDQLQDFNAFARVLYTANNEGASWDRALEILARRYEDQPKKVAPVYKPTSIADIKRALQLQATELLGRGLTPQEAKPLAQRIQKQEVRQRTMGGAEQPISTTTLIEQGVQKEFAPEVQAFNFARFAQSALGYAGSGGGVQPDVELETMGEQTMGEQ
jgi:hypothetical protein